MAEYPVGQERLLKRLVSTFRCQICRHTFEGEQVRVAARHDQLWVVSVRCRRCRNQQVFWFALTDKDEQTMLRDLSEEEEQRFSTMDPVGSDDILDVHEFLQDFNGDFKGLFTE